MRNSESSLDSELFDRILQKDQSALAALYDRHATQLYGLALKILKDETGAQDVLQDLFVFLWGNADKFKQTRGGALSWMMILCRNRCIDKLREKSRRQVFSGELGDRASQLLEMDESESPFEHVHINEVGKRITRGLEKLPDEQRVPIEMAYFQGLTQSEIAGELSLPLGTVKTRIRLGMLKLREFLQAIAKS